MSDAERDAWLRLAKALEHIWVNLRSDLSLVHASCGPRFVAYEEACEEQEARGSGRNLCDEGRVG